MKFVLRTYGQAANAQGDLIAQAAYEIETPSEEVALSSLKYFRRSLGEASYASLEHGGEILWEARDPARDLMIAGRAA